MSLAEFEDEKIALEAHAIFAEYKEHRFDGNRSEQVKLFQERYDLVGSRIFDFQKIKAAGEVVFIAASQTVRYEEPEEHRKSRMLADLPSHGYSFTDVKGVHNVSLFSQSKRHHEGALLMRDMRALIPDVDSPAMECLVQCGHQDAVRGLENLREKAVLGEEWVVDVSKRLVCAHKDGWAAVEHTFEQHDIGMTDEQRKSIKEWRKEKREDDDRKSRQKPNTSRYSPYHQGYQQQRGSYADQGSGPSNGPPSYGNQNPQGNYNNRGGGGGGSFGGRGPQRRY
jgi:uncharacterized membrane protein YgcG